MGHISDKTIQQIFVDHLYMLVTELATGVPAMISLLS